MPDGSHKLANVGGITGELFEEAWGSETKNWIGKRATVDIRFSKNTGNSYIVLVPVQETENTAAIGPEPLRPGYATAPAAQSPRDTRTPGRVAAERGEMNKPMESITHLPEDEGGVNVADIPF